MITDGVAETPEEAFHIIFEEMDREGLGMHQIKGAFNRAFRERYEQ
jgi:hypothetical protein